MGKNGTLTIQDVVRLTGKSKTTVYRYIKQGKLKGEIVKQHGKELIYVANKDLEEFLGETVKQHETTWNPTYGKTWENMEQHGVTIEEIVKKAINEAVGQRETQLMKRIEDQALYKLGAVEKENLFLRERLETIRQENELLREQIKALPGPVELENKENIILLLQKEKEEQTRKTEGLNQVLLDNANNIKELTKEKDNFQSALKEQEATIREKERALKELEEIHRAELELSEKKQMEISEAWKKELELAKRPWWKFW